MRRIALLPLVVLILGLVTGCGKKDKAAVAVEGKNDVSQQSRSDIKTSSGQHSTVGSRPSVQAVQRPAKQQQAIDAFLKLHGTVLVDPTKPDQPVIKVVLRKSAGNTIRGSDLEYLAALDTIEELDLSDTATTDITHVASLKRLKVFSTPPLTPEQFQTVASLPSLETLACTVKAPERQRTTDSNVPVKDRRKKDGEANEQDFVRLAITQLAQSKTLRQLRMQPFSGVVHCTDGSFSPLFQLESLRYLELSGFIVTDRHLSSISECKMLETLVLHGNNTSTSITGTGMKQLAKCSTLKTLDMRGINDDIMGGAASVPTLTSFTYSHSLSGRKVTDSMLIRLKRDNPNLRLANGDNTRPWAKVVPARTLALVNGKGWNSKVEVDSPGEKPDREELVERVQKGMSRQAVIALLGQPDGTVAIGQGQGLLYYLSDEEAFFISIDKNGNVFSADRQERSK